LFPRWFSILLTTLILLVGCVPVYGIKSADGIASNPPESTQSPTPLQTPDHTPTPQPGNPAIHLWIASSVPDDLLKQVASMSNVVISQNRDTAVFSLDVIHNEPMLQTTWVYTLVAPFPTLLDDVPLDDLLAAWKGEKELAALNGSPLLLSKNTLSAFTTLWGEPDAKAIKVLKSEEILETAWQTQPSWALIPFEELQPRWKILRINGMSPLDRNFKIDEYPLTVHFGVETLNPTLVARNTHLNLPVSNYDSGKMTSLILTGTTAMVRYFALRMEEKGVTYPAQDIVTTLKDADILHISNEVSFWENCPAAKPVRREMRFCSDPSYIELLKYVGTDVVELTGNHLLDWGEEPFIYTLKLYEENKLPVYGGGLNREAAQRPFVLEHHGNRLAFLGCNAVGPQIALATDDHPGAAPCDLEKMKEQIAALLEEGNIPIVTFQHFEAEMFSPQSSQRVDFQAMAQAGAVIVSGSQAHYPQGMTFVNGHFVHYGLGNFFFDQMDKWNRQAFIDRHIFYNGHHINTELITIILEDYARPRVMTDQEREKLLKRVFSECVW